VTDLVSLAAELHRIDLETGLDLALSLRKSNRPLRQTAARKGVETKRSRAHRTSSDRVLALRAKPARAVLSLRASPDLRGDGA
jgi:hypothetical protein